MSWLTALGVLGGILVVLLMFGVPVALAFFGVNIIGAAIFMGGDFGIIQMIRNSTNSLINYSLAPIPLFIMMGEILLHSGIANRSIDAIERLIVKVPARMSVVCVAAGTAFTALSGSSIANTAMLGRSLLPGMLKRGYHPTLSIGPIMAAGAIAMLIPPSALAVLFGSISRISISKILIAGITPALMMAFGFLLYVILRGILRPQDAPTERIVEFKGGEKWMPFIIYVLPLSGIIIAVMGSLVAGWATPSESAALGAAASFATAACYKRVTWSMLVKTLSETAKTSGMILFIIMGSSAFGNLLDFSGATEGIVEIVAGMGAEPLFIVTAMMLVLLVLGCFVDQVSMIMLTVPIFIPVALAVKIDGIWLAIVYLVTMEMAFLTPPFGLLLFVMRGVAPAGITMKTIYKAAVPFLVIEMVVLALLVLWPEIGLWLPRILIK